MIVKEPKHQQDFEAESISEENTLGEEFRAFLVLIPE
jgi:hypothetical protein